MADNLVTVSPGPTALHPLQRMQYKCQVKTPSEYTFSLFWAELSSLLGEKKIPVAIVELEPGTSGSIQRFNHLATKQPQTVNHGHPK